MVEWEKKAGQLGRRVDIVLFFKKSQLSQTNTRNAYFKPVAKTQYSYTSENTRGWQEQKGREICSYNCPVRRSSK